jgi:hypothetical protein
MPLVALRSGQRVDITRVERPRQLRGIDFTCQLCGASMVVKAGDLVRASRLSKRPASQGHYLSVGAERRVLRVGATRHELAFAVTAIIPEGQTGRRLPTTDVEIARKAMPCVHCGAVTSDWWTCDGQSGLCKCNACAANGLY